MGDTTCSAPKCTDPWVARGLCGKHYQRKKKTGSLEGYPLRICLGSECGAEFRPDRRDQLYCSKRCKVRAAVKRRPKKPKTIPADIECRFCHAVFTPSSRGGSVCYSEECQRAYHTEASNQSHERARAARPPKLCANAKCRKEFIVTAHNKTYCSPECKREALLERRRAREYRPAPIFCEECGEQIPYKSGRRRFCSDEHRKDSIARHARWKTKGITIDHGMPLICGLCGATEGRLDIDHDHTCCPKGRSCGKCTRGFLCRPHNVGLGMFGDDPEQLRAAADYIERFRATLNGVQQ